MRQVIVTLIVLIGCDAGPIFAQGGLGKKLPKGFVPPKGSLVISKAEYDAFRANARDLTGPSQQRLDALSNMTMSYTVSYRIGGGPPESYKVHESPTAVLIENAGRTVFAWSETNGGFFIGVAPGAADFSVAKIITARQIAGNPGARFDFEQQCGMATRGLHPHGGPGSKILELEGFLNGPGVEILSRDRGRDGLLKIRFKDTPKMGIPGALASSGSLLVDPTNAFVVHELEQKFANSDTRRESRTY